jgi:hypothetical protein
MINNSHGPPDNHPPATPPNARHPSDHSHHRHQTPIKFEEPATASAAVADITNDYTFCTPPAHIIYRHWQKLITTPGDTPTQDDFVTAWANLNHEQRSTLIALVLAHRDDSREVSPAPSSEQRRDRRRAQ